MEKTSREEQKVKTKMYREMSRKTQTRLEQGPMVAEIVTQELDMLFVSMIMREYSEGPFSKNDKKPEPSISISFANAEAFAAVAAPVDPAAAINAY